MGKYTDKKANSTPKAKKIQKELEKYYEEQNEVNAKFIPVSLLEEKIEELKENGYWNYLEERDLETTIGILQELLEKR